MIWFSKWAFRLHVPPNFKRERAARSTQLQRECAGTQRERGRSTFHLGTMYTHIIVNHCTCLYIVHATYTQLHSHLTHTYIYILHTHIYIQTHRYLYTNTYTKTHLASLHAYKCICTDIYMRRFDFNYGLTSLIFIKCVA